MSEPRPVQELEEVRGQLVDYVQRGVITCHYSIVHLSEMAPVEVMYSDAAHRRANLLGELCKTNALLSIDRIFLREAGVLLNPGESKVQPYSEIGEWYPEGMVSPLEELDFSKMVSNHLHSRGYGRNERRKISSQLLKNGRPTAQLAKELQLNERIRALVDTYPISPAAMKTVWRYIQGAANAAEASEAFRSGLLDPTWIMLWFAQHHRELSPFIEWTRAPARQLRLTFESVSKYVDNVRNTLGGDAKHLLNKHLALDSWERRIDETISNLCDNFQEQILKGNGSPRIASADEIKACCPGISTAVGTLALVARASLTESKRQASPSDFADSLHAVYAPYVDIFRADGFVADHVRSRVSRYGTTVVSKLRELPNAIEVAVANRAA